jgi:hypothetical protein
MADQPARLRFPIVASSESQTTVEELIARLAELQSERERIIQESRRVRDKILLTIEEQNRRDEQGPPQQPEAGESASNA